MENSSATQKITDNLLVLYIILKDVRHKMLEKIVLTMIKESMQCWMNFVRYLTCFMG